ncbi:MAG TPA: hypothetical protein VFD27_07980 [Chthoniobacteraceae bacterium]|nr:hypothetical protein [Chthoniobacteraceae bacterium]
MRKLIVILLVGGAAYYFYTRRTASNVGTRNFTLPESIAWKCVAGTRSSSKQTVEIVLVHGDCWRIESKTPPSPKTMVALFDGSQFVSNNPKASTAIDPRTSMRKLLAGLADGKIQGIERRDGHSCWHFTSRQQSIVGDVWVDTQTRFPVFLEGPVPDGTHFEARYSLLQVDLAARSAQYFNTRSTSPLFTQFLTP